MSVVDLLSLLLAIACAVIAGFVAILVSHRAAPGLARALLVGGGAGCTALGIYIAAVAAYR
ncbi:hypothetical protein [Nonomuraea typhae]|uniref:Sensor histidine kinase n=1 Tax=Nonomuraea typhae TaxID=2603600 RepID=A0ABW7Z540_9ACTN